MSYIRRLLISDDAQGLVEMAFVLPILLMLLMAIFEFGRIYGSYLIISNLARDGARYGIVGHSDSQIKDIISSQKFYLDEERLKVIITPTEEENRAKGSPLEVEVDYSVPLIAPLLGIVVPDPFPLTAKCSMRIEI